MKVAYVLPSLLKPSGWRTLAVGVISSLGAYVEPVLFVSADDHPQARELFPGRTIQSLPETQSVSLGSLNGARRLLTSLWVARGSRRLDIGLVHSLEAYPTGLVGASLARRYGCPHVLTANGTYGVVWHETNLDRRAYRWTLRQTRLICPVSNGTARMMNAYFNSAMESSLVRPILIGNDFTQRVPRRRAEERVLPPTPTLLSVGDVKPRKGHHLSLAAFQRVKKEFPAAAYRIVGRYSQNPYYDRLIRYIEDHHLRDVGFLGAVPDGALEGHYQGASVFVLTPQEVGLHFEGFGLVYLEAGAYGVPVVGTRTGGVSDAVKDGVTGFLADPQDVDGIAEAISRLLRDQSLNRQIGLNNREWAETLTWERYAEEQYRAYQELLKTA